MNITEFLSAAVTPYQCVETAAAWLLKKGFREQKLTEPFSCEKGGKYFLRTYETGLIAYTIGEEYESGGPLCLAVAHTDSPCLRVKPVGELLQNGYRKIDVEVYGGAILPSWYDRPLSMAGRVVCRTKDAFSPKSVVFDAKRPLFTIPNLAIHMNREVNKGVETKPQRDMLPLLGCRDMEECDRDYFLKLLAKEAGVSEADILDYDVSIYACEKPCYLGENEEMLSAGRLDNLVSCYALLQGIEKKGNKKRFCMAVLFDHEEIGSRSAKGADCTLTKEVLERAFAALGMEREDLYRAQAAGLMLSVDGAHALHPNRPEVYDPVNRAMLGKGVVIKVNHSQRYAFDAQAMAVVLGLCEKAGIPYQKFANHSDLAGGSTLGPILSSWLPMRTIDLGIPMLAMHSARELGHRADIEALTALLTEFYKGI